MTPNDVAAWRARHRLTQGEAAQLLGVDLRSWRKWERGERRVSPLVARFLTILDAVPAAKKAAMLFSGLG
jgi:DNA-binding transcriptional regulator YiaG